MLCTAMVRRACSAAIDLPVPVGVIAGSIGTFVADLTDINTYNPGFRSRPDVNDDPVLARQVFLEGLLSFQAYMNIHTPARTAGEIRGQLTPEPSAWVLAALGVAGIGLRRRLSRQA
jgi:hypothetical protein